MYNDKNNVYALTVEDTVIHASEAISGRQGYFCLGCKKEMQAVRSSTSNRIDYFRHDSKNVVTEAKCTYSDETYRHKLAKDILQRLKRIKVPPVYKYPPKNQEGLANRLEESKYIDAAHVGIEVTFYEDESGNIHFGSNKEIEERFLTIRPDVVFFNEKMEPILFIEIVVTHGIKNDKLIKLKRLGIDTVQIRIPRDSPESIEKNFHVTDKIKWVYNNVEQKTEYVPVASPDSKGVSPIDELQRKLQEESFACRTAEIGNLVRAIKRCLESEPYRESEQYLTEEISRTEGNTRTNQTRLDQLRTDVRSRVQSRYSTEVGEIESGSLKVEGETKQFQKDCADLENRYKRKRRELEEKDRQLGLGGKEKTGRSNGGGESIDERKRQIARDTERANRDFESGKKEIGELHQRVIGDIERTRVGIRKIIASRKTIPGKFEQLERKMADEFKRIESGEITEIGKLEGATGEEPVYLSNAEERLRREFEGLRVRSLRSITSEDGNGDIELSRGIDDILQARRLLIDFEKVNSAYKRNREAWDCFNQGTYKNWTQ